MPRKRLASASASKTAAAIRSAIGSIPDEPVNVMTPQFTRPPEWAKPGSPPVTAAQWEDLRRCSGIALREMGLRAWGRGSPGNPHDGDDDDPTLPMLWLLPGEWYASIPVDYPIVDINFQEERFVPGVTDDDIRFGCLPFGILAK